MPPKPLAIKKLIAHSGALYLRTAIGTVLALFSTRIVLRALGTSDFGIYSVIGGVMGFLGFIVGALASSAQRHLSLELGRGEAGAVARMFHSVLLVHVALAALMIVIGETFGLLLMNTVLNLPAERAGASMWVFQCTVLASAAYVLIVPYQALLTAHESFINIALLGIAQSVAGFGVALLVRGYEGDRLLLFAATNVLVAVAICASHVLLCKHLYSETRALRPSETDVHSIKELVGFSGWNLLGALSVVTRSQGVALTQNAYFGVVTNAALGIATQVSTAVSQLTHVFLQAMGPRVVKMEGAGRREAAIDAALLVCRYSFLVAVGWCVPLLFEVPLVLRLWLVSPPPLAETFCRLLLLVYLVDQLSSALSMPVQAIGVIRRYQLVSSAVHLSTIPLGLVMIWLGAGETATVVASVFTAAANAFLRPYLVGRITAFPYGRWMKSVVLPAAFGAVPSLASTWVLAQSLPESATRAALSAGISLLATCLVIGLMIRGERLRNSRQA